jgi:Cellulose biosynthesis protein BcsS
MRSTFVVALFLGSMLAPIAFAQTAIVSTPTGDVEESTESLFVAAGQIGGQRNSYGTVGVVTPLPGSKLGNGWVARVFADEVTYSYDGAGNRTIDGTALGGSASVGYMGSNEHGWYGVYAGPGYRHLDLSPDDRSNDGRGHNVFARVQAEGEQIVTEDFKVNGLAGTDLGSDNRYWARVRPLARAKGDIYVGPEAAVFGDEKNHAYQVGAAVVGIHLNDKTQIGVNGGYRKGEGQPSSAYGGVELGSAFQW